MKEAKHKKPHTLWFQLYEILIYSGRKSISACLGLKSGMDEEYGLWGKQGKLEGDRNVLYLDCTGGYTAVYICQNSLSYTPKIDVLNNM